MKEARDPVLDAPWFQAAMARVLLDRPRMYRSFVSHVIHCHSFEQVAKEQKISLGTVYEHVKKVRSFLKKIVEDVEQQERALLTSDELRQILKEKKELTKLAELFPRSNG